MGEIAVVIPAYNAANFIDETVTSVRSQDTADIEIIVVDDGSQDATPRLIESFAKADPRIVTVTQANQGVATARNTGIAAISPEATSVMFLDHDDVLLPGALTALSGALRGDRSLSAMQGQVRIVGADGDPVSSAEGCPDELARRCLPPGGLLTALRKGPVALSPGQPTTFESMLYGNSILSPGQLLIRRSALREAGGFDPGSAPSDDWDFYLRLTRIGPIGYLAEPKLAWRLHGGNASRDAAVMQASSLAVRRNLVNAQPPLTRDERKAVRRQFAYTSAALLAAYMRRDARADLRHDVVPSVKLFTLALGARARPAPVRTGPGR